MVYNYPSDRLSFEVRALYNFVVGWAKLHYRYLFFWLPATRHEMLIVAQDMLKVYKQLTGKRTMDKITHTRMVQKMSDILSNAKTHNL